MDRAGQAGIRLRIALACGDVERALSELDALDDAHHVEILLGAAIRDERERHGGVGYYLRREWAELVTFLCGTPSLTLDHLAAAYVASRRAPVDWCPHGRVLTERLPEIEADVSVARWLADGVSGASILDALAGKPLHAGVAYYYHVGTIHALGVRPLLILAASADYFPLERLANATS